MAADTETAEEILEALRGSPNVDASEISVDVDDGRVVVAGRVATHEEADAAAYIVESSVEADVENRLVVDPGLRDAPSTPQPRERVEPAENEVLVGDPDMLAGPEHGSEPDIGRAMQESEPWDPPEVPMNPPTAAEGEMRPGGDATGEDPGIGTPGKVAPDLSEEDIKRMAAGGPVPSLDPERVADREPTTQSAPGGVDPLGRAPDEESAGDRMPEPLPDAQPGSGAIGEHALEGGSTGAVPATETGAVGADTAEADPARQAGGNAQGTGTHRGPGSPDDPAVREDYPTED